MATDNELRDVVSVKARQLNALLIATSIAEESGSRMGAKAKADLFWLATDLTEEITCAADDMTC